LLPVQGLAGVGWAYAVSMAVSLGIYLIDQRRDSGFALSRTAQVLLVTGLLAVGVVGLLPLGTAARLGAGGGVLLGWLALAYRLGETPVPLEGAQRLLRRWRR